MDVALKGFPDPSDDGRHDRTARLPLTPKRRDLAGSRASLSDDEVLESVSVCFHMRSRWDLALMKMIAEVERRRLYLSSGEEATEPWLSHYLGIGYWQASVMVKVALMLEDLPKIKACYADGEVSYDHLRAVVQIDHRQEDQDLILDAIKGRTIRDAFRNIRKMSIVTAERSDDLYKMRWLKMRTIKEHGVMLLEGLLPEDMGAAVRLAIDTLARSLPDDPDEDFTPIGRKRVDALAMMATSALGQMPSKPTLVVHVDEQALEEGEGMAEIQQGPVVSVTTARRLACNGSVAEMGPDDEGPGRKHRTATYQQMTALKDRDGSCRFPGCNMAMHLEAHHIQPWRKGGTTTLDNLVLVCPTHHRAIERGGYQVVNEHGRIAIVKQGTRPFLPGPPPVPGEVATRFLEELRVMRIPRAGPGP